VASTGKGVVRWIATALCCVACSSGSSGTPDAGTTGGSGGANGGSGGAPVAGAGGGAGIGGSGGLVTGGGGAGAGGAGGSAVGTCTFDVQHTPSPAIGTVEIVTFSLDEPTLTGAHIDFGPAGAAPTMTAPVDLAAPMHRTLLLGLKGSKPYTFRIVATAGAKTCTSADVSFTTGAVLATAPKITKTMPGTGAATGFMVTTSGVNTGSVQGLPDAYIFDTDGDLVWWTSQGLTIANSVITRAHLSWDGKSLWFMTNAGKILNVSMDGAAVTDYGNVIKRAHHDLTVLPDGAIATMLDPASTGAPESIVEMKPDGTITTVVADLTTIYRTTNPYPNSIHYYAADDSYTLGDRMANLYVKFRRSGQLVWQLGGSSPMGKSFTLVGLDPWMINHGHHLTPDGRFLFFNNGAATGDVMMPRALEVMLDEAAATATKTWEYHSSGNATALGDTERLPNGNALVTNSFSGLIQEVDPSGKVVQQFTGTSFGYVDFRTSLYGAPPR